MTDADLAAKQCEPCQGGVAPMGRAEAEAMLARVSGWVLQDDPMRVTRRFKLKDFMAAQAFAVAVGQVSEDAGHHPDILYGWGYCTVTYWTHKISGLHENDFILAARVNVVAEKQGVGGG